MRCFYFGVWQAGGAGHHLYLPSGRHAREQEENLPFSWYILDSRLLPPKSDGEANQGRVYWSVINGWTVLTFWDRSGDSRPGSNSAFVLEGEHTTAEGLELARQHFPAVLARFPFPLMEVPRA